MSICAHTLVKNEERYVWYAVKSVINYVDKLFLWDTGSTDGTIRIINELKRNYPEKISFKEMGEVNPDQFTVVRAKMLEETNCDWVLIVDGDEVWWDEKIKEVRDVINNKGKVLDSIVSMYFNPIGDIFHYQDKSAGKYNIDSRVGNYNIRAFRKIKGLKFTKPHGQQAIVDSKNILLQDRDSNKKYWQDGYSYLHFTNMRRSHGRVGDENVPKRDFKFKYEIGRSFPLDFYYPEVFFSDKPESVPEVWTKADFGYLTKAYFQTPLKILKRKYFASKGSGY